MTDTNASDKRLLSIVERIERVLEEKQGILNDIKDIYQEAKGVGYDVPTIKSLIKIRKKNSDKRREEQSLLETYAAAIQLDLF